jgi:hypothetical protein
MVNVDKQYVDEPVDYDLRVSIAQRGHAVPLAQSA